jgi:hypothetical protein
MIFTKNTENWASVAKVLSFLDSQNGKYFKMTRNKYMQSCLCVWNSSCDNAQESRAELQALTLIPDAGGQSTSHTFWFRNSSSPSTAQNIPLPIRYSGKTDMIKQRTQGSSYINGNCKQHSTESSHKGKETLPSHHHFNLSNVKSLDTVTAVLTVYHMLASYLYYSQETCWRNSLPTAALLMSFYTLLAHMSSSSNNQKWQLGPVRVTKAGTSRIDMKTK